MPPIQALPGSGSKRKATADVHEPKRQHMVADTQPSSSLGISITTTKDAAHGVATSSSGLQKHQAADIRPSGRPSKSAKTGVPSVTGTVDLLADDGVATASKDAKQASAASVPPVFVPGMRIRASKGSMGQLVRRDPLERYVWTIRWTEGRETREVLRGQGSLKYTIVSASQLQDSGPPSKVNDDAAACNGSRQPSFARRTGVLAEPVKEEGSRRCKDSIDNDDNEGERPDGAASSMHSEGSAVCAQDGTAKVNEQQGSVAEVHSAHGTEEAHLEQPVETLIGHATESDRAGMPGQTAETAHPVRH